MEQTIYRRMSESFRLRAVLVLTGGFLDACTYLIRNGMSINTQTGNIVLLGVRLMEGGWSGVSHYLVPILAFAVGVLAVGLIRGWFWRAQTFHQRQITTAMGLLLLVAMTLLPAVLNSAANVLVAFICAVQVGSSREVNGNAFVATVCAGNPCSGTERLYLRGKIGERGHKHRAAQYYSVIVFSIIGAALGVQCSGRWGQRVVSGACVFLLAVFLLIFQCKSPARTGKGV